MAKSANNLPDQELSGALIAADASFLRLEVQANILGGKLDDVLAKVREAQAAFAAKANTDAHARDDDDVIPSTELVVLSPGDVVEDPDRVTLDEQPTSWPRLDDTLLGGPVLPRRVAPPAPVPPRLDILPPPPPIPPAAQRAPVAPRSVPTGTLTGKNSGRVDDIWRVPPPPVRTRPSEAPRFHKLDGKPQPPMRPQNDLGADFSARGKQGTRVFQLPPEERTPVDVPVFVDRPPVAPAGREGMKVVSPFSGGNTGDYDFARSIEPVDRDDSLPSSTRDAGGMTRPDTVDVGDDWLNKGDEYTALLETLCLAEPALLDALFPGGHAKTVADAVGLLEGGGYDRNLVMGSLSFALAKHATQKRIARKLRFDPGIAATVMDVSDIESASGLIFNIRFPDSETKNVLHITFPPFVRDMPDPFDKEEDPDGGEGKKGALRILRMTPEGLEARIYGSITKATVELRFRTTNDGAKLIEVDTQRQDRISKDDSRYVEQQLDSDDHLFTSPRGKAIWEALPETLRDQIVFPRNV